MRIEVVQKVRGRHTAGGTGSDVVMGDEQAGDGDGREGKTADGIGDGGRIGGIEVDFVQAEHVVFEHGDLATKAPQLARIHELGRFGAEVFGILATAKGVDANIQFSLVNSEPISTYTMNHADETTGKEWMMPWMEEFYVEGLTTGCKQTPTPQYCPEQSVTRAEMATFLDRAFSFPQLP